MIKNKKYIHLAEYVYMSQKTANGISKKEPRNSKTYLFLFKLPFSNIETCICIPNHLYKDLFQHVRLVYDYYEITAF